MAPLMCSPPSLPLLGEPQCSAAPSLSPAAVTADHCECVRVCGSGTPKIGIGALVGAGIVVTMGVAGAVALTSAARINRRPFMRDAGFYVIAVLYLLWMLLDGHVHILEALGTVDLHGMVLCAVCRLTLRPGVRLSGNLLYILHNRHCGAHLVPAQEAWRCGAP